MIEVSDHQAAVAAGEALLALPRRAVAAALVRGRAGAGQDGGLPEEGAAEGEARVSVAFVDDATIRRLNRTYRGTDAPTDVLAFSLADGDAGEPAPGGEPLGEVVISLETAARQGAEAGHSLAAEVAFLAVHGTLHLLGHDHHDPEATRAMRAREAEIIAALGLEFPADLAAGDPRR